MAVVVASLTLASSSAFASSFPDVQVRAKCEAELKPTLIQVSVKPQELQYDFSKSLAELTQRSKKKQTGRQTLGLTETTVRLSTERAYATLKKPNGMGCLRPSLEVTLSASPQTIFIAREFPKGSCAFNEIMAHELRHARVNQSHTEAVARQLKAELDQVFGQQIFYGNVAELTQQFKDAWDKQWLPRIDQQLKASEAQHREIDSPQEYARNNTMCDGEVPRMLRKR